MKSITIGHQKEIFQHHFSEIKQDYRPFMSRIMDMYYNLQSNPFYGLQKTKRLFFRIPMSIERTGVQNSRQLSSCLGTITDLSDRLVLFLLLLDTDQDSSRRYAYLYLCLTDCFSLMVHSPLPVVCISCLFLVSQEKETMVFWEVWNQLEFFIRKKRDWQGTSTKSQQSTSKDNFNGPMVSLIFARLFCCFLKKSRSISSFDTICNRHFQN